MRGRLIRTAAAVVLVTTAAVAAPQVASADAGGRGRHGAGDCSLVHQTLTATASTDRRLTTEFTRYADTGGGWTGADSTFSLPLGQGRLGWFFSDTFLGTVNPDGSRPKDSPFVNNSIVVQTHSGLRTVTGGTPANPTAVAPPASADTWYWIGDPTYGARNTVQLPLLEFQKTGTGSFDFQWIANRLATLDARTLTLESISDLPSAAGINWGSWTLRENGRTYIYGINDVAGVRSAFVARVDGRDGLKGTWRYWNGSGWSASEADAAPIAPFVANEFSVSRFGDGYLLVTHDTSELFGSHIVAKVSCSPTGPFTGSTPLYTTPETGAAGSYGNANVFTYNSHEHPELRRGNTLLVTYNVNSFDNVGDVYDDASIYRPRFIDVTLTATH